MRINRDASTVQKMFKDLLVMMRACKKCVDTENQLFAKYGIESMVKGQAKLVPMISEFNSFYNDLMSTRDLKKLVQEETIKDAAKEYDQLKEVLQKYSINLEAAERVSNIFMKSIKRNMQLDKKMDYGYNKDGGLVPDKKILDLMPSVSVNNKV